MIELAIHFLRNYDQLSLQPINFLRSGLFMWYNQFLGACYSRINPTPVSNPKLVSVSWPALGLLGLHSSEVLI